MSSDRTDRPDRKEGSPPGCPYHAAPPAGGEGGTPGVYGRGDLTYNDYLRIPSLLGLQQLQSEPAHHDEMLFIIIHQAYELWFKLILHEMENAIGYMNSREVLRASHFMKRIGEIMRLLVQQIHILETMTPAEFLKFRDRLMPASGFQSTQYREIEFVAGLKDPSYLAHFKGKTELLSRLEARLRAPDLRSAYYELLRALGFAMPEGASELERSGDARIRERIMLAILPIYQDQEQHLPLYLLSESLVEFDEYLSLWREHHVRVVERVIGFKRGTGGSAGVEYLRSTTSKKCFPCLWEVRTHLEKAST
jgi:tryptophan 2,3-dioxygenase